MPWPLQSKHNNFISHTTIIRFSWDTTCDQTVPDAGRLILGQLNYQSFFKQINNHISSFKSQESVYFWKSGCYLIKSCFFVYEQFINKPRFQRIRIWKLLFIAKYKFLSGYPNNLSFHNNDHMMVWYLKDWSVLGECSSEAFSVSASLCAGRWCTGIKCRRNRRRAV